MNITLGDVQLWIGIGMYAIHLLSQWGVIRSKKVDALYDSAVRASEQWKKVTGRETGLIPTNEEVQSYAIQFLAKRLPFGTKVDPDKLEAAVQAMNAERRNDRTIVTQTLPEGVDRP